MKIENILNNTPIIEAGNEADPLCSIRFLEGQAEIICVGTVAVGGRLCMAWAEDCTTTSHTQIKGSGEGRKQRALYFNQ